MELSTLKIAVGLLFLIIANILLGSITAILGGSWNWKRFLRGILKGCLVVLALAAVYAAGYLNPDLVVIDYEGQNVNLMTAVLLLLTAAYIVYGKDVIQKLRDILLKPKYLQLAAEDNNVDVNDTGEPIQKPPDDEDSADE